MTDPTSPPSPDPEPNLHIRSESTAFRTADGAPVGTVSVVVYVEVGAYVPPHNRAAYEREASKALQGQADEDALRLIGEPSYAWDDRSGASLVAAQTATPLVLTDPEENLRVGADYYAEHTGPPILEKGYAPGGIVRGGRQATAERLAHDVIHETGGSPEWHAVVSELIDHLTGGLKQKISIPCPPLGESSSVDSAGAVSPRGSGAPGGPGADDPATAAARPPADRPGEFRPFDAVVFLAGYIRRTVEQEIRATPLSPVQAQAQVLAALAYRNVVPCHCDDQLCEGWAVVPLGWTDWRGL